MAFCRSVLRSGRTQSASRACKPDSVEDGHSSRRRITARAPATYPEVSATGSRSRQRSPRGRTGPVRRTANWAMPFFPPYLVLLRVGFTLPPGVTAGAVRSYRTFSPLPERLAAIRRYLLCGTSRLAAFTLQSRTLSGTLPCGVRTFLSHPGLHPRGSGRPARLQALF